jgi:hypothetical protein
MAASYLPAKIDRLSRSRSAIPFLPHSSHCSSCPHCVLPSCVYRILHKNRIPTTHHANPRPSPLHRLSFCPPARLFWWPYSPALSFELVSGQPKLVCPAPFHIALLLDIHEGLYNWIHSMLLEFFPLTLNKPATTWRVTDRVEVKVDLTF